jgi:hypothetical protein
LALKRFNSITLNLFNSLYLHKNVTGKFKRWNFISLSAPKKVCDFQLSWISTLSHLSNINYSKQKWTLKFISLWDNFDLFSLSNIIIIIHLKRQHSPPNISKLPDYILYILSLFSNLSDAIWKTNKNFSNKLSWSVSLPSYIVLQSFEFWKFLTCHSFSFAIVVILYLYLILETKFPVLIFIVL